MEINPNTPRQRNRRADRAVAQESAAQPTPIVQRVQTDYQQPIAQQPAAPAQQAQPVYPQTPRTMYQQTYPQAQQPVRPTSYPHTQQAYVQNGYLQQAQTPAPVQRVQQAQPTVPAQPAQYAPRPRALNQPGRVDSGWQQPTVRQTAEVPHARATSSLKREAKEGTRQGAKEKSENPTKKKLPGWLTTAVSLSIILVMALAAAYWLMQAYLTTQENERIAAYEAVLDNYHITEDADGTLYVTWQDEIERYAAQYNLQPAFVTAIIRTESSFRTNAESSVGARGLMQMMPDTAEWIAGKLDDASYTFDRMYDAETNIRYGCWYLGYLSKLFRGDAELVSAAYHAGQTTVTQWLSDPAKSSDGVTLDLDRLSDGPTKQYIGRVTLAYGIYQSLLYPDEAFGAAGAVSAGSGDAAALDR